MQPLEQHPHAWLLLLVQNNGGRGKVPMRIRRKGRIIPVRLATQSPLRTCDGPEHRQFDFWIGDWEVTTPDGKPAGRNRITRELNGCVLHEHWTGVGGMSAGPSEAPQGGDVDLSPLGMRGPERCAFRRNRRLTCC